MASGDPVAALAGIDRDAYVATLMAPAAARPHLAALHAFAAEIAAIPSRVREPMAGMVRLQWWRDALSAGAATGNPVADALISTIAALGLPLEPFLGMLEGRSFDLYDDPMPGRTQLEGYLGETRSALIQVACMILSPANAPDMAEKSGHAGCALGMGQMVAGLAEGRGGALVPLDILAATGVAPDALAAGVPAPVREALSALAREHLAKAGTVPSEFRPAFAMAALARPLLAGVRPSALRRQWTMTRFALTGRL